MPRLMSRHSWTKRAPVGCGCSIAPREPPAPPATPRAPRPNAPTSNKPGKSPGTVMRDGQHGSCPARYQGAGRPKFPGGVVNRVYRVDGGLETPVADDRAAPGPPEECREEVAVPAGSNAYNSLWQVRTDAWSALEESTAQLALAGAQQRPVEQLTDTVAEALDILAPIERFWAFPGMQAFYKVRRLFATGKYDRCATMVSRINRALATDSYRGSKTWDADADDDAYDHETRPADQGRQYRPYFEVLIVEDMTEDQERALREELRHWRRPDDQFLYEIVVVPSFDEAVMAARLNFKLQACVVRRRFAHRSRHDCSSLAQFVSLGECEDLMD